MVEKTEDYNPYLDLNDDGFSGIDPRLTQTEVYLRVLQKQSEVLEENEELRPGMLYMSDDSYVDSNKTKVVIIPLWVKQLYTHRKQAQGSVIPKKLGRYLPNDPFIKENKLSFGRTVLEDGSFIEEEVFLFGYINYGEEYKLVIFPIRSYGLSKLRTWLNKARTLKIDVKGKKYPVPLYMARWKISVEKTTGEKSIYIFNVDFDSFVDKNGEEKQLRTDIINTIGEIKEMDKIHLVTQKPKIEDSSDMVY